MKIRSLFLEGENYRLQPFTLFIIQFINCKIATKKKKKLFNFFQKVDVTTADGKNLGRPIAPLILKRINAFFLLYQFQKKPITTWQNKAQYKTNTFCRGLLLWDWKTYDVGCCIISNSAQIYKKSQILGAKKEGFTFKECRMFFNRQEAEEQFIVAKSAALQLSRIRRRYSIHRRQEYRPESQEDTIIACCQFCSRSILFLNLKATAWDINYIY